MTRPRRRLPLHRRLHRRLLLVGAALAVPAAFAACSLPVDERVTPVDRDEFGDQLTQDTTTTTTSTTAPPTTVPEDTSVPTEATTTTLAVVPTEIVTVYYTRGTTDVMQPVDFLLAVRTPIEELIALLERPTGIREVGFRTAVRPGLIDRIGPIDRGVATVALDGTVLDRMSESARQQAIAQIVLTVTSFRTADAGAIGRVRFEVEGEGLQVFVPAFGGSSEAGEELAFEDFQSLISSTPTPATTVAPGTTTSVPAPDGSAPPADGASTSEPVGEGGQNDDQ